jgi:hypothetical protein
LNQEKKLFLYNNNAELTDLARTNSKATNNEMYAMKDAARKRAENEHSWGIDLP